MTNTENNKRWFVKRAANGEKVGGGFFVFRRGKNGRIRIAPNGLPFEHETIEAARHQAVVLSGRHPDNSFCVFQQVAIIEATSIKVEQK